MQEKKVKVLVFGMTSIVGGIETFLMNMYNNMDLSNLQIDFLVPGTLEEKYKKKIESRNGRVYEVEKIKKHPIRAIKQLKKLYKDNNYDVIHMNLCNAFFFIYALPAVWNNKDIKIIGHSHNGGDSKKFLHLISKPILSHYCTNFIACSDVAARWLFNKKKTDEKGVLFVNNAIDTEKFVYNIKLRESIREKYKILPNEFIIGHVGRFEEQKNHSFLVEIFKQISQERENVKLLLVGTGSLEEKIKKQVKNLNLENKVIFTGVCTNINEIYQAMDVFILPSIFEGLPVSGIEAQASGLKCLLSDTITKEVEITNNIKFLPIENKDIWVREIENLIDNHYERKDMSLDIKNANYDMKTEVNKIEKLYLSEEKK